MNAPKASQSDRFHAAAQEIEADQSDDALERVIAKLDLRKKPEPTGKKKLHKPE